jgi:hypothetical protein
MTLPGKPGKPIIIEPIKVPEKPEPTPAPIPVEPVEPEKVPA